MFWLKLVKSIITILQSEVSPNQVAAGAALGACMGLTPVGTLQNFLIFILIMMLNVNIGSATLAALVFSFIGMITDPLANLIGYYLLVSNQSLGQFWTNIYNMPVVPFTRFYNTVVMGNIILAILFFIPVFLATKKFLLYYRANLRDKVAKWKIMKVLNLANLAGGNIQKFS